MMSREGAEV